MNSLIEIDNKLKEMYMRAKKDNCVYCVYKGGYKNLFDKYTYKSSESKSALTNLAIIVGSSAIKSI